MKIDSRVTGKTRFLGLIGNPVEHSVSPSLHNSISLKLGLDLIYLPLKVEKGDLDVVVKSIKALDFVGFNVTIPYKKDIMKYLDDNTKEAILMGAVNTVKKLDGRFYGYNTDAEGFLRSFKEEAKSTFKNKNVILIGAGGAARPIAVKIAMEGAKKISLVNRSTEKSIELAEIVNENIREVIQVYNSNDKTFQLAVSESDIIINTTSVGMYPEMDAVPVEISECFNSNQIVYDIIYNPLKTKLLKQAEEKGCKTINGLGMLFYQGVSAYEIWTGVKFNEQDLADMYSSFVNGCILKEEK